MLTRFFYKRKSLLGKLKETAMRMLRKERWMRLPRVMTIAGPGGQQMPTQRGTSRSVRARRFDTRQTPAGRTGPAKATNAQTVSTGSRAELPPPTSAARDTRVRGRSR